MWQIGNKCTSNLLQSHIFLHRFNHLTLYSTSSSFSDYLEQTLGFTKQQSLSTSTKLYKYRQRKKTQNFTSFNFASNANSVLNFFKYNDFDNTHVKKIVSSCPPILLSNVDKTLKPKLECLKELGICGAHLVDFVCDHPSVLQWNLGPSLQPLRSVLGCDENVVKFLKSSSLFFFSEAAANDLVSNVRVLEGEYGICIDVVRDLMFKMPSVFLIKNELFRDILIRVEKELCIPRNSSMFFSGVQVLCGLRQKGWESKFGVFKDYGWTQFDVVNLFRQIPHCLALSKSTLRKKLDFLMKELGYEAGYLASHPSLLTFSLEKRILPRHGMLLVLQEKGLSSGLCFFSVVSMSETKFLERFVLPYEDVIPGLREIYLNSRGVAADGSTKKKMFKSSSAA